MKGQRLRNTRPTIGLFTHGIADEPNSYPFWAGVHSAAHKHGADLICFPGNPLRSPVGFDAQANVLYDLAGPENVDGLIIWGGTLSHHAGLEEVKAFCQRYRPLPMVSMALVLEGIPSLLVDSYQGMHDATVHLIAAHGCRRIAYIQGPRGHQEAERRYRGYVDACAAHGLPLDPNLVVPGNFRKPAGIAAMEHLLDRKIPFDAVVAADDLMAIGAAEALQARGIRVPGDVAVVGFDDIEESRYCIPSLTTARQPYTEMGRQAVEMLLAQLCGEETAEQVLVPSRLILRRSCGCLSPAALQAAVGPVTEAAEDLATALATRREHFLTEVLREIGASPADPDREWTGRLLDALAAEVIGKSAGVFLATLDEVLRQVALEGDVAAWQGAISALRHSTRPYLGRDLLQVEDLWQQARVMIGEAAQQVQGYRRIQAEQQARTLREINRALMMTFNIPGLMGFLAHELSRLGIARGYLSLYEDPAAPAEWSRLMLAYDERGRTDLETGGLRFPSRQLVPAGLLSTEGSRSLVVEPLYFRQEQLGFAVFEAGPPEGQTCDTLRGQISSALQGALLVEQVTEARDRLQAILDSTRDGILMLDERGHILLANPALEQWTHLPREKIVGMSMVDLIRQVAPGDQPGAQTLLEQVRRGRQSLRNDPQAPLYGRFEIAAGSSQAFEWLSAPALDQHGQNMGRVLILRDVTAAREAERLREDLTSMIVHDLRGPLTAVLGALETLVRKGMDPLTELQQTLVETAQEGGRHMLSMVNTLLDIRRLEAGRMPLRFTVVHLDNVVRETIAQLGPLLQERTLTLAIDLPPDLPPVRADKEVLARVLENLLHNAIKYSYPGGMIRVRGWREGKSVRCAVVDYGVGIPSAEQERIFERFSQVHRQGAPRGSGLGLAFCRLAITAQGGDIWVESEEGKGSTFCFTLPADTPPTAKI